MTRLEFIDRVIEIQEDLTRDRFNRFYFQIGTCFSFKAASKYPNIDELCDDVRDYFEVLFKDNTRDFWLTNPYLQYDENNLNRLTCLYLFREVIKGEE